MESHEADLRAEVHDDGVVRQIQDDYRKATLDGPTRAMLDFAVKLTQIPAQMGRRDIEDLRSMGFTDGAIVDIVQMVGYFNYINRVLDGLGADPEPGMRFRHSER